MAHPAEKADVAVVIPAYNHGVFLPAALRSVLAQRPRPTEIIVIDDGSHDSLDRVIADFPGVALVRQENSGLSAARNRGISETTASFLLFLDADDRLLPGAIASGVQSLNRNPSAAFTYGAYVIVEALTGTRTDVSFRAVHCDAFASFLNGNPIGMHGCVMYRRSALERVGGFREHLRACEDYDLYLRLSLSDPILCHDHRCAEYWHHGSNMSRDPAFMLGAALEVLGDYRDEAAKRGLLEDFRVGIAGWKRFYAGVWVGLAAKRAHGSLAMGLRLLGLAPATLIRTACAAALGRGR